jgi:hypothetical protein
MAKRKLLQWMRDLLTKHAETVVVPVGEKKALDAAYKKAAPLVRGLVEKRFPTADMKVLKKYGAACDLCDVKLTLPNGVVTQFKFNEDDRPLGRDTYEYRNVMHLADTKMAAAVECWLAAVETFKTERAKRLTAYKALIAGSSNVEDIVEFWPEAKGILPAGSPLIPLGPEQIAVVKADLRERKAA